MSWNSGFVNALNSAVVSPTYRLRLSSIFQNAYIDIFSNGRKIAISREGPSIQGQRVTPGSWNITFGSWSVPVVGDLSEIFPAIRKGVFAELFCTLKTEERITCGQLRTIRKSYNKYIFEFVDLVTALGSNYAITPNSGTLNDPDPFTLCFSAGIETKITPAHPWSTSNGTIYLNDISNCIKEQGQPGVVRCTPSGGNEFYLLWDSKTVTSGVSGYLTLSHTYTSNFYPSIYSASAMAVGQKVYTAQYFTGWPGDIFGKLLSSTTGTGGSVWNKYPPGMNSNIGLDLYDSASVQVWKDLLKYKVGATEVDYKIGYVVNSPLTNGWRDLIQTFANAGHWPVWRQNGLSYRGCMHPQLIPPSMRIYDKDIFQLISHELFSPDQHNIYVRTQIDYANVSGTIHNATSSITANTKAPSLPLKSKIKRDNSLLYFYDPHYSVSKTQRSQLATADLKRMDIWDQVNWEKIVLKVRLGYASLVCGDTIILKSSVIKSINTQVWFKDKEINALVIGVDYNISAGSTVLSLAIPFYDSKIG
tara:strand:- start:3261 stop:4856 length:1596 start_codon:yes stop_codon:yes gene_type:complete